MPVLNGGWDFVEQREQYGEYGDSGSDVSVVVGEHGKPVQVEITNDNTAIETAFSSLVTAYNAVVKDVSTQEGKDSSGNAEPLYGSPTLALIQIAALIGVELRCGEREC